MAPGEPEIDERTVAERRGEAVERVAGRRPPPPGWPGEALSFPLRGHGKKLVLGGALFLVALDALTWAMLAAGWFVKILVLPFLLRWQLHVAAMSAAGHDAPQGWLSAGDVQREHLTSMLHLLIAAIVLLLPGSIALLTGRVVLAVVLLVVGTAWLALAAMGQALGDPGLVWPGRAMPWIATRPLVLLVAAAGWWGMGGVEWLVTWLEQQAPFALALVAFVALRLVSVWLWLVSARALGVLGRDWTPFEEGPAEGVD